MRARRRRLLSAASALGLLGAVALRVVRALPLTEDEPADEGGGTKKAEKMDKKKKGSGPRTRRKKAKKGK
jgi:hypothetical protein